MPERRRSVVVFFGEKTTKRSTAASISARCAFDVFTPLCVLGSVRGGSVIVC